MSVPEHISTILPVALAGLVGANMKYTTKQKRLCALVDAYSQKFGKSSIDPNEVAQWAMVHGLYPCPKRGDPEAECLAWEARLEAAARQERVE